MAITSSEVGVIHGGGTGRVTRYGGADVEEGG